MNELRFLGVGHRKKMTLSSALIEAITLNQMAAKELESGDDVFLKERRDEPYLCTKISLIKLCAAWKNFYYSPPLRRSTSSFEAHCLSQYHERMHEDHWFRVNADLSFISSVRRILSVTVSIGMICFKIATLSNDIPLPEFSIIVNRIALRAAHSPHRNLSFRVFNQKIKFWNLFLT